MSQPDLDPPWPPNVGALLDAERGRPDSPDEVQTRARRRMEMALAVGTVTVLGAVAAEAAGSSAKGGLAALFAKLATKPGLAILLAFATGVGAGAGAHVALQSPPAPTIVYVDRAVPAPAETVAKVDPPPPAPSATEAPAATASPAAPSAVASNAAASPAASLAGERLLLEAARTALSRADAASAIKSLDRHAAKFARGELAEEREALMVQALAMAGRGDEAKGRAAKFRQRYRDSILAPAVDSAAEKSP